MESARSDDDRFCSDGHRTALGDGIDLVDDTIGKTLAATTTLSKTTPDRENLAANVKSAKIIGALAAKTAIEKGISQVVFDRSGARYHGKVKALAEAAREAGLKF